MQRIYRTNGTILVDFLLSLFITVSLIPIILTCLVVLSKGLVKDESLQDSIATYQLRRILALSYDPYIEDDTLYFQYRKKEMKLSYVNENIIIQPGTQIIYTNVDSCAFVEGNDAISIVYQRNGKDYEETITKK
jgi:hypothetical protein